MRDAIQGDVAAENIRIPTEPLLPEIFRYQCDVRFFFLFRQKISSENRVHAENIEIIGR